MKRQLIWICPHKDKPVSLKNFAVGYFGNPQMVVSPVLGAPRRHHHKKLRPFLLELRKKRSELLIQCQGYSYSGGALFDLVHSEARAFAPDTIQSHQKTWNSKFLLRECSFPWKNLLPLRKETKAFRCCFLTHRYGARKGLHNPRLMPGFAKKHGLEKPSASFWCPLIDKIAGHDEQIEKRRTVPINCGTGSNHPFALADLPRKHRGEAPLDLLPKLDIPRLLFIRLKLLRQME